MNWESEGDEHDPKAIGLCGWKMESQCSKGHMGSRCTVWEAQEFGHGCTKFEFLIRHVFLFYVEFCIQIGELVVFLFQYDSLSGTESFHNSLAGTETMVEGRRGEGLSVFV